MTRLKWRLMEPACLSTPAFHHRAATSASPNQHFEEDMYKNHQLAGASHTTANPTKHRPCEARNPWKTISPNAYIHKLRNAKSQHKLTPNVANPQCCEPPTNRPWIPPLVIPNPMSLGAVFSVTKAEWLKVPKPDSWRIARQRLGLVQRTECWWIAVDLSFAVPRRTWRTVGGSLQAVGIYDGWGCRQLSVQCGVQV